MYFDSFPTVPYDAIGNGNPKAVTNLLRRVAVRAKIKNNTALYDTYDVKEGETPELIAHKLYGDSEELVFLNYKSKVDTTFLEEKIEVNPITIFSELEDVSSKRIKSIYILIEEGKFFLKDIEIINAYIQLYPKKIAGLITVE